MNNSTVIRGSCLCGAVRFELDRAEGSFEICHCNRCRKRTGAQGMPGLEARSDQYRMTQGQDFITTYAAPILYQAPAYQSQFCSRCGSPVPDPKPFGEFLEIPAGLLDDDPGIAPDKHIFVEFLPDWDQITDALPQYTIADLVRERQGRELPTTFLLRSHYDEDGASKD